MDGRIIRIPRAVGFGAVAESRGHRRDDGGVGRVREGRENTVPRDFEPSPGCAQGGDRVVAVRRGDEVGAFMHPRHAAGDRAAGLERGVGTGLLQNLRGRASLLRRGSRGQPRHAHPVPRGKLQLSAAYARPKIGDSGAGRWRFGAAADDRGVRLLFTLTCDPDVTRCMGRVSPNEQDAKRSRPRNRSRHCPRRKWSDNPGAGRRR